MFVESAAWSFLFVLPSAFIAVHVFSVFSEGTLINQAAYLFLDGPSLKFGALNCCPGNVAPLGKV